MSNDRTRSAGAKSSDTAAKVQHTTGSKYMLISDEKTLAELRSIVLNYTGDPNFRPIRIFGLPGSGKSTLLTILSNNLKLEGADGDDLILLSYFFDKKDLDDSKTLNQLYNEHMDEGGEEWYEKVWASFDVDNPVTRFATRVPLATGVYAHKADDPIYLMLHPHHVYYTLHMSKRNKTTEAGRPMPILQRKEYLIQNRELYTQIVKQFGDLDHVTYDYSPQAIRAITSFLRKRFESRNTESTLNKGN